MREAPITENFRACSVAGGRAVARSDRRQDSGSSALDLGNLGRERALRRSKAQALYSLRTDIVATEYRASPRRLADQQEVSMSQPSSFALALIAGTCRAQEFDRGHHAAS